VKQGEQRKKKKTNLSQCRVPSPTLLHGWRRPGPVIVSKKEKKSRHLVRHGVLEFLKNTSRRREVIFVVDGRVKSVRTCCLCVFEIDNNPSQVFMKVKKK
jgi:hypothetical protein